MKLVSQAHVVDGYKLDHLSQYVPNTELVYSNMTPRSNRLARALKGHFDGKMIFFGAQKALIQMKDLWDYTFFSKPKEEVIKKFTKRLKNYVGQDYGDKQIEAMDKLHDLGYLPLSVKTLPEGTAVNMGIPTITIKNTLPEFYWLTNYCETYISSSVWHMCNAASLTREYRKTSERWAKVTGADDFWCEIANHCFAARGHRGHYDAIDSGMGHLLFSVGTDTLASIDGMEDYYNANSDEEMIGISVNAFEHATATQRIAYYRDLGFTDTPLQAEKESIRDICENLYPKGIVSYVSDSEDYFGVINSVASELKDVILNRQEDSNGLCKFVFRPDSSPKTPLEVICGDGIYRDDNANPETRKKMLREGYEYLFSNGKYYTFTEDHWFNGFRWVEVSEEEIPAENLGTLEVLWRTFGGTVNEKGYRVLNPKVGLIYGEAIDIDLQEKIYKTMEDQGWCVSNLLLGVGSWGFLDRSSRDSFSQALKGTHSIVDGKGISMQKNPKTAADSKKSLKGLIRVELEDGKYVAYDQQTPEQEQQGELKEVFRDGKLIYETSLSEIRERVKASL